VEASWRSWAGRGSLCQHYLKLGYGVLATGVIVGVLWAVLHFPVFFWMGRASGALPLATFVPLDLFSVVVGMAAFRVLMVWVYERSGGSMLVAGVLMHTSYTAFSFILGPLTISGVAFLTYMFAVAAVLWVVVAAVSVAQGGHLSRQPSLSASPDKWVVNGYPLLYETTNLRASFE
jgi:uncharacterized protein